MKAHQSVPHTTTNYSSSQWQGSATGELWDMEGGAAELAAGVLYRHEHENYSASANAITQAGSDYTCGVSSSYCSTPWAAALMCAKPMPSCSCPCSARTRRSARST